MTERELLNLDLWMWEYPNNRENYPGLHLAGRPATCDVLSEWLVRLRETPGGRRRSIPLRPLQRADAAYISGNLPYRSFSKLHLSVTPACDELQQMSIRSDGELVIVQVTPTRIDDLIRGLRDVRAGIGDYAIRPDIDKAIGNPCGQLDRESLCLWFWPCFGHLGVE